MLYEESLYILHNQIWYKGQKSHVWCILKSMYRVIKGFPSKQGDDRVHKESTNVCVAWKMFEFCICPEEWKVKTCWAQRKVCGMGQEIPLVWNICDRTPHSYSDHIRYTIPLYAALLPLSRTFIKILYKIFLQMQIWNVLHLHVYLHYILSLTLDLRIITDLGIIAFVYVGETYLRNGMESWGDTQ